MPPESCQGNLRSKPERLTSSRYRSMRARRSLGVEAHDLERQHDVALDGPPRIERGRLEDVAVVALQARLARGDAVDQDRPRRRPFEVGDDAQQRGLAAAGRADERDEVAFADLQIHIGEGLDLAVICLEGQRHAAGIERQCSGRSSAFLHFFSLQRLLDRADRNFRRRPKCHALLRAAGSNHRVRSVREY